MAKYLVTGATSGIGKAFILSHSQHSECVAIVRNQEKAQGLIDSNPALNIRFIKADLVEPRTLEAQVLGELQDSQHYFDALIYSAGVAIPVNLSKGTLEKASVMMNTNFYSFCELLRLLARYKPKEKELRIVVISALAARQSFESMQFYAASKAALEAYVRCTAKEALRHNILINAIAPAYVDTPMARNSAQALVHEDFDRWLLEGPQPAGIIPPEEVVAQIDYLLTHSGRHTTGTVITINGGC